MKWRVFLFFLVLFSPICIHAQVRITEIAWMGMAKENGQFAEWIELHNDGPNTVDLNGWKILSEGGSQLIFTLTKSIAPGDYLLVERTTASSIDAVAGINDESGAFGGGGLSNTGEYLVLKDSLDTIIQSLNYASGWPAGDVDTKETMQWNDSGWVTAPATPKKASGHVGQEEDDTTENESDENDVTITSSTSNQSKKIHVDPRVSLTIPANIHQRIEYRFKADVLLENGVKNPHRGIYRWNFGDGSVFVQENEFTRVVHTYAYPGTYNMWFGYYDSVFDEDPTLSASALIRVQAPNISLSIADGDAVRIINETDKSVDLSQWKIVSGINYALIPQMTTLASGATIVIPGNTLGMSNLSSISLWTPDGYAVASTAKPSEVVASSSKFQHLSPSVVQAEKVVASSEDPTAPATDIFAVPVESSVKKQNHTKEIIFGAVSLFVIGLFLLLERFMARKE